MTLETEEQRGRNAQALLDDPLLSKALEAARREIIQMWEETPSRDAEAREWLWKLYQASKRFENILLGHIESGKVARANLAEKKSLMEHLRPVRGNYGH
jgi:transposase